MTDDRHAPDAVEQFLADLGQAPVPALLASSVAARVRVTADRERRTPAPNPWLPIAAAFAVGIATTLALVIAAIVGFGVATRAPEPAPIVPPSPTASASESAEPSPSLAATPAPATPAPTPMPTPTPPADAAFDLLLPGLDGGELSVRILDPSGLLADASPTDAFVPVGEAPPGTISVRQGADSRTVLLGWATFACDERAVLSVESSSTIRVRYPPRPGCDTVPAFYALTLTFQDPVDAASIDARQPQDEWAVTIDDLRPTATTWIDELNGWLGGRTTAGDAVIAHTRDGGVTWQLGGHHAHDVSDMAAVDEERAIVGTGCFESMIDPSCTAFTNIVGQDGGGGIVSHEQQAWTLSFEGRIGYGRFADLAPEEVRRSADGGDSWTTATVDCVADDALLADISPVSESLIYATCTTAPVDGRQHKELLASDDGGRTWERLLDSSQDGGLPDEGSGLELEMAADGSGVMWSEGQPEILRNTGGGWEPWREFDGQILDVAYLGSSRGAVVLVANEADTATWLLRASDGTEVTEIWRRPPDQ